MNEDNPYPMNEKPSTATEYGAGAGEDTPKAVPVDDNHLLASSVVDENHRLGSSVVDEQHRLTGGNATETDGAKPEKKREPKPGNLRLISIIALIVIILIALLGIIPKVLRNSQIDAAAKTAVSDNSDVQYVQPQPQPPFQDTVLPGNIEAVEQTSINARATGYVQSLLVDIGDKVVKGQTLAIIDAPDVDQELSQARAQFSGSLASLAQSRAGLVAQEGNLSQAEANLLRSIASVAQARQTLSQSKAQLAQAEESAAQQKANLVQAQANLDLARITNQRYQNLVKQGAVDQETADQQYAAYQTNAANVDALAASLSASQANTDAYRAGVRSNEANVTAFESGVTASRAAVATAEANVDSSRAVVNASEADVSSNEANVSRYEVLVGFNNVVAPFTGVITARNIDTGDLVGSSSGGSSGIGSNSAGASTQSSAASGSGNIGTSTTVTNSSGSSSASSPSSSGGGGGSASLFSEAQLDTMHVYVNVPQSYAFDVQPGIHAKLKVAAIPGKTFIGTVTRNAGALDPSSRTLVTEVKLTNPGGVLKPGMFAEVQFHLPTPGNALLVPDTAIVSNTLGTQVIIITAQNTLHFQPITVSRDLGSASVVETGLSSNDKLVANPTDSMQEGQRVTVASTAQPFPKQSS